MESGSGDAGKVEQDPIHPGKENKAEEIRE